MLEALIIGLAVSQMPTWAGVCVLVIIVIMAYDMVTMPDYDTIPSVEEQIKFRKTKGEV